VAQCSTIAKARWCSAMPTTCGTVKIGSWPDNSIGEDTAFEVNFGLDFEIVPAVSVQLAAIDAASPNSKRIEVWASDETTSGFRLHARTWEDAATYGLKVSWVATSDLAMVQLGTHSLSGGGSSPNLDAETVNFPRSFACSPDIVFGFSAIDAAGSAPVCSRLESLDTHARGFVLKTRDAVSAGIQSVSMSWIACASPTVLQAGAIEVGTRSDPIKDGVDRAFDIRFGRAFDAAPSVVLALAGMDVEGKTHTRIDTWSDGVTSEGFRLHVRSWEDSITWRVRISWIATPVVANATASNIPPHQPPAKFIVDGPPLGQGWCAVTHRVKNAIDGNVLAVKTSRYPFKQHEQALRQELQNLARLPLHFNLLRYHESILQAGRLHIVMEYLDAFRLVDLMPGPDGTCKLVHTSATVLRWIYQLLDGLAHLHGVGLVHRDLHGENVLVERAPDGSPSDGPRAVRIIDFGAAGRYDELTGPRLMSQVAGCPQYFSPERRRGHPFDDRDDVWAAGCHVTELASGRAIRMRQSCGDEGSDFSTSDCAVTKAIADCECGPGGEGGGGSSRLRGLAEAILVGAREQRPRAAQARDVAGRLLSFVPGKRPSGPSGGSRAIGFAASPWSGGSGRRGTKSACLRRL